MVAAVVVVAVIVAFIINIAAISLTFSDYNDLSLVWCSPGFFILLALYTFQYLNKHLRFNI